MTTLKTKHRIKEYSNSTLKVVIIKDGTTKITTCVPNFEPRMTIVIHILDSIIFNGELILKGQYTNIMETQKNISEVSLGVIAETLGPIDNTVNHIGVKIYNKPHIKDSVELKPAIHAPYTINPQKNASSIGLNNFLR